MIPALAASAASLLWIPGGAAVPRESPTLRVCADPNNLPFSGRAGTGLENELAQLIARDLGRVVEYTWWPQRRGFIRSTLNAGLCDVVMGLPAGFELADLTRPYYGSRYVFVVRRGAGLEDLRTLDDPRLRRLRIGLHAIGDDYANVPPAAALAARGIVGNITGYSIYGDYSRPNPPAALLDAVASGDIDVAIAWGPLAGWFAQQRSLPPLLVRPIEPAPDRIEPVPLAYAIALGVRKGNEALRLQLQDALARRQPEIRRLLEQFHVPLAYLPQPPAAAPERVYVTNERSGDLSVIDAARSAVVATLPLGKRPRGLLPGSEGRLYVALSGSPIAGPGVDESTLPPPDRSADGIGIIDLEPLHLERVLRGVSDPEQVAHSEDGRRLFVASEDTGTAVELDVESGRTVAARPVGVEPEGIAMRPGGTELYVASEAENRLTVIDTATGSQVALIALCARPRAIAFARKLARAYVSCENDASVAVVDTERHLVSTRWSVPGVNARPMGLALSPDESTLYVTTGRGRTLVALETGSGRVRGVVDAGARPWGVAVSHDGATVYTANGPSNDVSVIDAASLLLLQRIPVGSSPWGVITRRLE